MHCAHALTYLLLHHDNTFVTPLYDRNRFLCLAGSSCNGGEEDSVRWYHWYPLMNGLFILVLALVYLIWHQVVVVR